MSIIARYSASELESKEAPLWFHKAGLSQTASGYGRKLATRHMVKLPGGKRWRRVYVCCYANSGTAYVPTKSGDWIVIT